MKMTSSMARVRDVRITRSGRPARLVGGLAVLAISGIAQISSASPAGPDAPVNALIVAQGGAPPAADVSEEISGGNGAFVGESNPSDLEQVGYVQEEFVASGTATDYRPVGDLGTDGRWTFEPDIQAPYRTRILVRRPKDVSTFSGAVVVEWNNVSGGVDANPDYASLAEEITRRGHIWVGVTTQLIGVEGGPVLVHAPGAEAVAGKGLKGIDPARYGTLSHPGDGYSFDIFTQIARAARRGAPAFGAVNARRVLALGESQSAIALTTYYNGIQPRTRAFDGFFVHSRAYVSLPLVPPGKFADLAGSIGSQSAAIIRTDLDVPVLELQTEADVTGVLKSVEVRQRDSSHFRLWEVAGTAHADAHLLGPIADNIDCGTPINNGAMHVVAKAGLRHLDTWVRTGKAPAKARRIQVTGGDTPEVRRDADGIALGGIRTPPVDVPVDVLSGVPGPNPQLICILLGSTTPLPDARLAERYSSRRAYQREYNASIDKTIKAGFALNEDRKALRTFAEPSRITD